ncbi:MAG: sodium:alanine symporter family protein [Zetaproteobacteria bacterium]|nr:sodium:alanine symporter family protein [Zetaproteobacteria bacterium]
MVFIYLQLGVLFLILTRGIVWRGIVSSIKHMLRNREDAKAAHHVSHHHAFFAALAATVGVGNLAGVGTAIHLGGPGALFWMWVSALLGMSFRMSSVYWAVKMGKHVDDNDPHLFASPMLYMVKLLDKPWKGLATGLAILLFVNGMVMANMIQSNSVAHAMTGEIGSANFGIALMMAGMVGLVIIGGMQSIIKFAATIAPWMILAYLATGWFILASDPINTLEVLGSVFYYAFNPYSFAGGVIGYTIMQTMQYGISRGIFSHGSGMGFAAFWQGANHDHPSRSAFLAGAVPLIDTLVVCSTTGLVILSADMWLERTGAFLTVSSFHSFLGEPSLVFITCCLVVFAFTTIISWAHFGERCFQYLGGKNVMNFRWLFVAVCFIGPFLPLVSLWALGDIIIGCMILIHMIPLTYIVIRHLNTMKKDLQDGIDHPGI